MGTESGWMMPVPNGAPASPVVQHGHLAAPLSGIIPADAAKSLDGSPFPPYTVYGTACPSRTRKEDTPMTPRLIMLDTDIGPDCDDAAALALLNLYAHRGLCRVLCVTHCTSSPYGAGAIRAVNRFYGHDFPVGVTPRQGFLTGPSCLRYSRALSDTLPPALRHAEDAVPLMLRLLAHQEDHSVHMVGIGPLNNLADLLRADPALVAQKCASFTLMAGCFPTEPPLSSAPDVEWNIQMDVTAAHTVWELWQGPMTLCGWECGARVPCGAAMMTSLPPHHPVRLAYQLYTGGENRPSWDLLTVRHACMPLASGLTESAPGRILLDAAGHTAFIPDPTGPHRILRLSASPADLAQQLDRDLCETV